MGLKKIDISLYSSALEDPNLVAPPSPSLSICSAPTIMEVQGVQEKSN